MNEDGSSPAIAAIVGCTILLAFFLGIGWPLLYAFSHIRDTGPTVIVSSPEKKPLYETLKLFPQVSPNRIGIITEYSYTPGKTLIGKSTQ
jgi:hypothetical protein